MDARLSPFFSKGRHVSKVGAYWFSPEKHEARAALFAPAVVGGKVLQHQAPGRLPLVAPVGCSVSDLAYSQLDGG